MMADLPRLLISVVVLLAAATDLDAGIIPNRLTYLCLALLGVLAFAQHAVAMYILGAFLTGGLLLLIHLITKRRGLGMGDVKLGACIGAALGPRLSLHALAIAFITGGAIGASLLAARRLTRRSAVPFGPFLAAGTLSTLMLEQLRLLSP